MKLKFFLWAILVVVVIPNCLTLCFQINQDAVENSTVETEYKQSSLEINLLDDGTVQTIPLEQYLHGVLLGELPVDFEIETYKAQAVAARTYTLRRIQQGRKHENAWICTDSSCCQAYEDPEDYLERTGKEDTIARIQQAVIDTSGQVLTYQGELIDATYFSCSGGRTETAFDVWGTDVPYLQSVFSPGEEIASHYQDSYCFSVEEFCSRLGIDASSDLTFQFSYTSGGGVEIMEVGNKTFTGTQVRTKLNLPSTVFSLEHVGNEIQICTKGFGHRVGMSQYGAEAMAVLGNDYEEILQHYYPGTDLETFSADRIQRIFDKAGNL